MGGGKSKKATAKVSTEHHADTSEDEEKEKMKRRKQRGRRLSVSAECVNVKASNYTPYTKKVIPKTEEQLKRIHDAVAHSFLFDNLNADQKPVKILPDTFSDRTRCIAHTATAPDAHSCQVLRNSIHRKEIFDAMFEKKPVVSDWNAPYFSQQHVFHSCGPGCSFLRNAPHFLDRVAPGETVIEQGDLNADNFYVVDDGELDCYVEGVNNGNPVVHYKQGGSFGELALMYNAPRAATIKCCEAGAATLWAVDRETFRHVVVLSRSTQRTNYEGILKKIEMLQGLSDNEKSKLADALVEKDYTDGTVIIRQGDDNYEDMHFFLVEAGVAVAMQDGVEVGTMAVGDYFGEKALIEHNPRAATVTAKGPLKVASLDTAAFERIMGPCKEIMERHMADYKSAADVKKEQGGAAAAEGEAAGAEGEAAAAEGEAAAAEGEAAAAEGEGAAAEGEAAAEGAAEGEAAAAESEAEAGAAEGEAAAEEAKSE